MEFDKKRLSRLKWACRRGMLELDVLFMPFVEEAFADLEYNDQVLFEKLLTCDDPDLWAWIMGHEECKEPDLVRIIDIIVKRVKV